MPLIKYINANRGALLPVIVKNKLRNELAESKNMCLKKAQRILLNWTVWAMPIIAEKYNVTDQAIDSLQHYRFGSVQAEHLIKRSGASAFSSEDLETFTLFNGVHDIGRMMVGSPASKDIYGKQGALLHPIVGAVMLREAFDGIAVEKASDLAELFRALVMTAERHTMSIGLSCSTVAKFNIDTIKGYSTNSLYLADAEMEPFGRFAHLVALADLINNVDQKLSGVYSYDPLVDKAKEKDPQNRIDYMITGPRNGEFSVRISEDGEPLFVNRVWRNGKLLQEKNADFQAWLKAMETDALQYIPEGEKPKAREAFYEGVRKAGLLSDTVI